MVDSDAETEVLESIDSGSQYVLYFLMGAVLLNMVSSPRLASIR